jgi:hypothetical protein
MANILSSLVQAIPAILTGFEGRNNKKQKAVTNQATSAAQASIDPNSAQFQNLYNTNRASSQQDLASTIAEISRQNRKAVTMGRSPLLSQERGGETIFRGLMGAQAGLGDQARRLTFDQLTGGVSNLSRASQLQGESADQDWQNKLRQVGAFGSIGDAMRGMGIGGPTEDMNDIVAARQNYDQNQTLQQMLSGLFGTKKPESITWY